MSGDRDSDWQEYYERTKGGTPRRTLLTALDRFGDVPLGRRAVDLGCGDGRDAVELLRRGWRVLAIDAERAAIERLRRRADIPVDAVLETRIGRFEDETWPPADLVNASFSLPLCVPERFIALWPRIVASLKPDGRFAGQLFGDRDDWRDKPGMTFLERPAVDRLFDAFEVEMLEEEESDALTPYGKRKHWHLFHVVARKR
ncbi:MAG TPA: class I SAM-dependent methyltransferase [Stellaceae bacterium]|nr:class I SAM-dependent methyltransferase [Stellaceae bacterium]